MPSRTQFLLFFIVALFLCSWHLDTGHNDNTMARALTVASLVDRGTMEITPLEALTGDKCLVNGRYYSDKAPLPTFVVLPFHWLLVRSGIAGTGINGSLSDGLLRLGGFICGSIPLALLMALAWKDLRARRSILPLNAALLATLPFFGSFLFVYGGSFYNHLPEALFAVLAARSMSKDNTLVAGLCGGAAFLCGSAMLLLVAVWGLQLLAQRRWRFALLFTLGVLPALVLMAVHNACITGHPLVFPNAFAVNYGIMHHQYGFGTWQPAAFFGLLFSDYRGVFFYMPFLLLFLFSLRRWKSLVALLSDPFVGPALLLICVFMTHATWAGGWCYGPRYITAAAALLTFAVLDHITDGARMRWITLVLCSFGIVCAFAAKFTVWYSLPTEAMHPLVSEVLPHMLKGEWSGAQWPVLLGLSPGISELLFLATFALGMIVLVRIDRSATTHAPLPLR